MPRELVWTDSLAMGVILILVGLCVCVGAVAGFLPSLLGAILVGLVMAGVGVILVRQGMGLRPQSTTDG